MPQALGFTLTQWGLVELSSIRVKRKGRLTIPVELRRKLEIRESSTLEVREQEESILVKPTTLIEGGKVVGREAFQEIMHDLGRLRKKWR